jgi:3-oxoacyl-[acyl-carrier protein] reductase
MELANEIALVTGASRGLGSAIALELAGLGARVVGTATAQRGADAITASLSGQQLNGFGLVLDVTDPGSVRALVDEMSARFGAPTILVNNAGVTGDSLLLRMKDEEWDRIIDTDLSSVYRMCKACLRAMIRARHGRIVNITSIIGCTGNAGQSNYAAAKAGMVGFTKSLAHEVGPRGITVNAVAPGFIDTDMTRTLSEDQRRGLAERIPLQRFGSVTDVANVVAFLVSSRAAYITGTTVHVNGGMYMP